MSSDVRRETMPVVSPLLSALQENVVFSTGDNRNSPMHFY